jgi:adenylate kinase family enzyme
MGILICGHNGTGKSTLGKELALALGYQFIDNEDLLFPKTDESYMFSSPRNKKEVITSLEEMIEKNDHFIFAAVKGDYGDKLIKAIDHVILIEVPKNIRYKRVRERSYQKFGERIKEDGDLFEKESKWFSIVESRPENYVTSWLGNISCPIIRIDGTLPIAQNIDFLLPILDKLNVN